MVVDREPMKLADSESPRVAQVLQQFVEVFGEPERLPPNHASDHRIELVLGMGPISVRPYRYGHMQKDEIE